MKEFLFARPTIPEPEAWLPYLEAAYSARFFTNQGPVLRRLESALTDKYGAGARQAVMVTNATAGLTAALLAVGARGSVVMPSFTLPATGHAVLAAGGTPVLCDIDPDTWELDPERLAATLRDERISAVIHVRAFGFCRSLHPVADLVRRHGIPLIVDAAAALGGRACDGSWVGMSGDVEVFSMHATKTFNIGEGGMLLTSPDIADTARSAINFHLRRPDIASPAMNAKVDEFRAAVALAVLERIEGFVERRRAIAERYSAFFRLCPGVAVPANVGLPPWQCYPIQLPRGVDVAQLVRRLAEAGLEARPYYRPALHRTCLFGRFARGPLPVTEEAEDRTLCLPVYSDMTEEELAQILAILKSRLVPLIEVQTARLAAG